MGRSYRAAPPPQGATAQIASRLAEAMTPPPEGVDLQAQTLGYGPSPLPAGDPAGPSRTRTSPAREAAKPYGK